MVVVTDWLAAGGDGFGDLIEEATVLFESKITIAEAVSFYRESNIDLKYSTLPQFSRSFLVWSAIFFPRQAKRNQAFVA